ncbi:hypothetical protein M9458_003146, partial [Cirrhinus mrigala]
SHELNKAELHALYASLQPEAPPSNSTPPPKAEDKVSRAQANHYTLKDKTLAARPQQKAF